MSRLRPRYRCKSCRKTFSQRRGTMFARAAQANGVDRDQGCRMIAWMGLATMVPSRLWRAGTVSLTRDRSLADHLMRQVRACAQAMGSFLICTDGWAAYPNSIRRAFREQVKKTLGRGRACVQIWPDLHIGTVIKWTEKKRVVEVSRTMSHGSYGQAETLLKQAAGGSVLNTAFIERLNATMRERLATLTRTCRHGPPRVEPKRRGQPKKQAEQTTIPTKRQRFRPLLRLRKGVLCSTTS